MKHSAIPLVSLLALLALVPFAAAHGYVDAIAIDGKRYGGNLPNDYKFDSPIRLVSSIDPVKLDGDPQDLPCGINAQKAVMVVDANPGSTYTISWSGVTQNWPHQIGPLLTYMASCGSTPCDQFDHNNAKWFKIDQMGQHNGSDVWYQNDLSQGKTVDVTLPQHLAPGGYLIRHEILSLHLGTSVGGAEFYPSCTQVKIGGNGNGQPDAFVSFPGAYHDKDPGIYVPDIYDGAPNYQYPGGPVANLVSSSGGNTAPSATLSTGSSDGQPSATHNSGSSSATDAAPTSSTTGTMQPASRAAMCRLKKQGDAPQTFMQRFVRHFIRTRSSH